MDPNHTADMFTHLQKQRELLNKSQKSMQTELLKLQVEEEMLTSKYYELMTGKKRNGHQGFNNSSSKNTQSRAMVNLPTEG